MGLKLRPFDALTAYCASRGYPAPVAELRFAPPRRWMWDACWPDRKLAVEFQGGVWLKGGGGHTRGKAYTDDCEKYSTAAVMGWRLIQATSAQVADGTLFGWLDRALGGTA